MKHPYLITFALCVILAVLLLWALADVADASSGVPPTIHATVQLQSVYCAGPCCCGYAAIVYRGHYYDTGGYCKWFRPLANGQRVTTTLRLVR